MRVKTYNVRAMYARGKNKYRVIEENDYDMALLFEDWQQLDVAPNMVEPHHDLTHRCGRVLPKASL